MNELVLKEVYISILGDTLLFESSEGWASPFSISIDEAKDLKLLIESFLNNHSL